MADESAITELLIAWSGGDEQAHEELMPLVYERLRRLASSFLRHESPGHTLQTGALINEAYLRLVRQDQVEWRDRTHFFAIAGQLMRRILVDHARRQAFTKHGGEMKKVPYEILEELALERPEELVALDEALQILAEKAPELVRLVELRYFSGLNKEEVAEMMGISSATVTRRWRMAKAWLHTYLTRGEVVEL